MKQFTILIIIVLSCVFSVAGKTKKYGTWLEFELTKEVFKKLELSIIPELRLQDDFSVDEYLFDGKVTYEPFKFLNLAAIYRVKTNVKDKGNEISERFAFDLTGKKDIDRFDLALRTRFTNYTDTEDEEDNINYFRPRLKLSYDIKGNKIRPFVSYELFRNLTENEITKSRLDAGFTRKMGKIHRIGIYYRLQDYFSDRESVNILGIDYRLKF